MCFTAGMKLVCAHLGSDGMQKAVRCSWRGLLLSRVGAENSEGDSERVTVWLVEGRLPWVIRCVKVEGEVVARAREAQVCSSSDSFAASRPVRKRRVPRRVTHDKSYRALLSEVLPLTSPLEQYASFALLSSLSEPAKGLAMSRLVLLSL